MRKKSIPYGKHNIDSSDIKNVVKTLRTDWITQGPKIAEFEKAIAHFSGAKYGVAVSNGTAALHAAVFAAGIGPGDEVIVPPITFVATVNSIVYQGGKPIFVDVDPETLLLNPKLVEQKITSRTKAILAVDYAGQPCDYDQLQKIAGRRLTLISDACHSLGARYKNKKVGTLADLTAFSFHPVKHITTGEGGMVVTSNPNFVQRMIKFRNHGLSLDNQERVKKKTWRYSMQELGYNYRITDFQCALGISQLKKLPTWLKRRNEIARTYDGHFKKLQDIQPLKTLPHVRHAYHLYVIRLKTDRSGISRDDLFSFFRKKNVLVNVHYLPVHLQPFYRTRFKTKEGMCPIAEQVATEILSLPMYPSMTKREILYVVNTMKDAIQK